MDKPQNWDRSFELNDRATVGRDVDASGNSFADRKLKIRQFEDQGNAPKIASPNDRRGRFISRQESSGGLRGTSADNNQAALKPASTGRGGQLFAPNEGAMKGSVEKQDNPRIEGVK
jgi:hypothetical protein